ncbi:MAG: aspartyl protease family protein [Saprospiraceae bacterium]|nr:aspartyl protease family protein [Saprospiraceae bacterium]MCB9323587.1 aspartyl protease family protein [Lewinellaceae bacterium]
MKKRNWLILFLFLLPIGLSAQLMNNDMNQDYTKLEIPFEYQNSFIIVKVVFNNLLPLHFIFDTGAEHTILTRREITDVMGVPYQREFTILGADLKTILLAYLVQGVRLEMGDLNALNHSILVLDEDYFDFEKFAGIDIQGIIGADITSRFVVEIDYQRRVITLHDPAHFEKPKKNFSEMPIEIDRHKPYLRADAIFRKDQISRDLKLLIDTGAGLSLLLNTATQDSLDLPQNIIRTEIGTGLGGYLEGYFGRIDEISFGEYSLHGVLTNFQERTPEMTVLYEINRDGLIGNELLSRFNVTIDYITAKMYLQPNRRYDRKFVFDRSGLVMAAGGKEGARIFYITYVVPGSPAEKAGIQKGDVIKSVNRFPVAIFELSDLYRVFRKRVGKKIRLMIERDDEKKLFHFKLQELI